MAIYTHKDVYLSFGGTVISDHVVSLALDTGIESLDKTAMGASTRISRAGLDTWTLEFEVLQDFAASELDALVAGLSGREAAIEVRVTSGSATATNPKWTGTALVTSYNPVGGAVGDQAKSSCSCVAASALVRATS